jgi:hypothetical protein
MFWPSPANPFLARLQNAMAEELPKPDLTFVTTEELIDELIKRHKALIIVRELASPTGSGRTQTFYEYAGGLNTALGLAERARADIVETALQEGPIDEDDEGDEELSAD